LTSTSSILQPCKRLKRRDDLRFNDPPKNNLPMSDSENLDQLPRLYRDLADWWPLLSSPDEYAQAAEFYRQVIVSASAGTPKTVLELGSGGGNNASFLKRHFEMTLVDVAPGMLDVSRQLNPECTHICGDMRSLRLGRQFDAVFIEDAILYMTSEDDLRRALRTAYQHCKPAGVALFAPDHTGETFKPGTTHGGHDREDRSLRYLEWSWDPDPGDTTYLSVMVYLMREASDRVQCVEDRHVLGLFRRADWLRLIAEVGFEPRSVPFEHGQIEPRSCEVFFGLKQAVATDVVPHRACLGG
jgi:SAM-dependent methyltransferase